MNTYTTHDLSQMDNEAFLKVVKEHPRAGMWQFASAFAYAALRVARIQGLVIKQ